MFREVRRVLRRDGTCWLNLGDSYASSPPGNTAKGVSAKSTLHGVDGESGQYRDTLSQSVQTKRNTVVGGLKPKDLVGIPWRVAFALQADGWWLRSDIIWAKPNPMPESVTDRPTRAHEYIFLLTKSARYFYDADAIREEPVGASDGRLDNPGSASTARVERLNASGRCDNGGGGFTRAGWLPDAAGRNRRSVWTVATQPYPEAHFATFPPKLVEPCILAGTSPKACGECGAPWERVVEREGDTPRDKLAARGAAAYAEAQPHNPQGLDYAGGHGNNLRETKTLGWRSTCDHDDDSGRSVVLDPFAGSGTTGVVALRHDRSFIGLELNESYCELARNRIRDDAPLLNAGLEAVA